jgi:hypothetical protein
LNESCLSLKNNNASRNGSVHGSRISGSPAGLQTQPDGECSTQCTCSRRFTTVTTVTATHAIEGTQLSRTASELTQPENYIDRKCCVQLEGKVEMWILKSCTVTRNAELPKYFSVPNSTQMQTRRALWVSSQRLKASHQFKFPNIYKHVCVPGGPASGAGAVGPGPVRARHGRSGGRAGGYAMASNNRIQFCLYARTNI